MSKSLFTNSADWETFTPISFFMRLFVFGRGIRELIAC